MNPIGFWILRIKRRWRLAGFFFSRMKGCDKDGSDYIIAQLLITTVCFYKYVYVREEEGQREREREDKEWAALSDPVWGWRELVVLIVSSKSPADHPAIQRFMWHFLKSLFTASLPSFCLHLPQCVSSVPKQRCHQDLYQIVSKNNLKTAGSPAEPEVLSQRSKWLCLVLTAFKFQQLIL